MSKRHLEQIEIIHMREDAQDTAESVNNRVIALFSETGDFPQIVPSANHICIIYKRLVEVYRDPSIPERTTIPDREFININTSGIPADWRECLAKSQQERDGWPWWKKVWHYFKYPGTQPWDG